MWVQALASNPLTILAVSILILVLTGRGAMNKLIEIVTKLVESTAKNAENVDQLEVLYRGTITEISKSTDSIENRLIVIERLIREAIRDCTNGNSD